MFTRTQGNLLKDLEECYRVNIPGNVQEDSGESLRRLLGMFGRIPGNVWGDSGECSKRSREWSRRFQGLFEKIPENVPEDIEECFQF